MKKDREQRNIKKRGLAWTLALAVLLAGLGISVPMAEAAAVPAGVYVAQNKAVDEDFITGVDVSSFIAERASGVTYYDFDGKELSDQGFFDLLRDCGVNYVRVRIWNDPYDADGQGYGGGNCDLAKAVQIGTYATNAGMKVMVDFHLSDWWCDPGRSHAPKAWSGMSAEQKAAAAGTYITSSLGELKKAGVDVGIVQVGNEVDHGLADETEPEAFCKILKAGAEAVRAFDKNILVAIHYANSAEEPLTYAGYLQQYGVDYDVFALSYYSFWHGPITTLEKVMKSIVKQYGKKVMVTENYWPYTLEDGDGDDNVLKDGAWGLVETFPYSVQGQVTEIASIIQAVTNVGEQGIGFCYWEPAWIPVQYAYDQNGNLIDSVFTSNQEKWEKDGSGWASSAACQYDPGNAPDNIAGGSEVDNIGWFDFTGHPMESLKVYSYIRSGTKDVTATVGKIKYKLIQSKDSKGNFSLTAAVTGADKSLKKVTIPQTVSIGGTKYKVTAIAENAFSGNKTITSVTIPKSVNSIGKNAFKNAGSLKTLTVKTTSLTSSNVGANAFSGTPKTIKVSVPKAKLSAYKKLFQSKGMNKKASFKKL